MSNIKIQKLTKRYGDMLALNDVSLTIESGEFLILLGPSGCGKTTLLDALLALKFLMKGKLLSEIKSFFPLKRTFLFHLATAI